MMDPQRESRRNRNAKNGFVVFVNYATDTSIYSSAVELMASMISLSAGDPQAIRLDVMVYPVGVWVVMAVVAVVNGGVRETALIPRIGEYAGHVLSTALLVGAILLISFVYFQRTPIEYAYVELVAIGVLWTVLTVGFEFLVGYIEKTPVSVTLGQYDVSAGQVWIAVPVALLLSPLVFGWYLSI